MHKRNLIKMFFYALITLGLYYLWWFYVSAGQMRSKGVKLPSFIYLLAPGIVTVLTLVNFTIYSYTTSEFLTRMFEIIGYILLVGMITGIALAGWWLWKYCHGIAVVTKGKMQQPLAFWLFIGLSFVGLSPVWPLIVQDYFNQTGSKIPRNYKKIDLIVKSPFRK